MGPQGLKDVRRDLVGARVVLANVMKHIEVALAGPGPPCPIDGSLLKWINNKHTLLTCNTIVSR